MARLPQLKNAETYRACDWDLKTDPEGRRYWIKVFCEHVDQLATAISQEYPETPPSKLAAFRSDYLTAMQALDAEPQRFERIDILSMDELRTDLLKRSGFRDPYRAVKARENELALTLLPDLLAELDASPTNVLVEKLAFGLMAGNIFDLGAMAAMDRYRSHRSDFRRLRAAQPGRPWFIDHLDGWRRRWADGEPYKHVAFFVDNAGFDVCLGCLPVVRWMLREGSRITLAANSEPALNDVTAPEVLKLLDAVAPLDQVVAHALTDERLAVVDSGGSAPLIDLTQLASPCTRAIADADLIILHGMGRAVESNSRASFCCDSLRVAVLKDQAVAERMKGQLLDCVFRFEAAG